MRSGVFTTPRPVPGRALPVLAAATLVALALPVFLLADWPLAGWALGAVLWGGAQALGAVLPRLRAGTSNLAAASVLAFGMIFRAVAVGVVLIAVAVSDASLAVAAAGVYALAYTLELGVSLAAYFGSPS